MLSRPITRRGPETHRSLDRRLPRLDGRSPKLGSSGPPGVGNLHANRLDLARLRPKHLTHPFDTAPLGSHQEKRPAVFGAEHAREAGSIVADSLQHLATLAHPQHLGLTPRHA